MGAAGQGGGEAGTRTPLAGAGGCSLHDKRPLWGSVSQAVKAASVDLPHGAPAPEHWGARSPLSPAVPSPPYLVVGLPWGIKVWGTSPAETPKCHTRISPHPSLPFSPKRLRLCVFWVPWQPSACRDFSPLQFPIFFSWLQRLSWGVCCRAGPFVLPVLPECQAVIVIQCVSGPMGFGGGGVEKPKCPLTI